MARLLDFSMPGALTNAACMEGTYRLPARPGRLREGRLRARRAPPTLVEVLACCPPAGFLSDNMEFQGQMWAFLSDGIGIITGSMMGTTPLTVYIESAAGIEDGGRTGMTGGSVAARGFFVGIVVDAF